MKKENGLDFFCGRFYLPFFIAQFIFFPIRHFKSEKKSAKKIAIRKFYA